MTRTIDLEDLVINTMNSCLFLKGPKEDDHHHGKYTAPELCEFFDTRGHLDIRHVSYFISTVHKRDHI